MSQMSDGGIADADRSLWENAGYHCLHCEHTFSTLFALGQHTGSPYMCGTECGVHDSAAELLNVPRAHLAI